jgi:hypothetical protein
MYTSGSGEGVDETAGTIATLRRIVGLVRLVRFSGTSRRPQRAFFNASRASGGTRVSGHAPGTNRGVDPADAEATVAAKLMSTAALATATTRLAVMGIRRDAVRSTRGTAAPGLT